MSEYPGFYQPYQEYVSIDEVKSKTYFITAISMIIAGAIVLFFLENGLPAIIFFLGVIGWLVALIIGFFARSEKTHKILLYIIVPSSAITITPLIQIIISTSGAFIVGMAFFLTSAIVFSAYFYVKIKNPDLTPMGKYLNIGLWAVIIFGIIGIFLSFSPFIYFIYSLFVAVLFSLYIFYDISLIEKRQIYSPYSAALNLYLDIFILFKQLLYILWILFGDKS